MPKRISVRVPEPCEVDIDVTPTRFTVAGAYAGFEYALDVVDVGGEWAIDSELGRWSSRDEATEHAVDRVCRAIATQVGRSRLNSLLA